MINTLYLPELQEMLNRHDEVSLREFCTALHPARTAEFMEGLSATEAWAVVGYADPALREEIFSYFGRERQSEIIETQDLEQIAQLVADLAPDDRVDVLDDVRPDRVYQLLELLPADERHDILRLRSYPDGSAGAVMTTEVAKLSETLSVTDALAELGRQAEQLETIYYLYVVDATDHLRGVVSTRQLVSAMGRPDARLGELMETDVVTVNTFDDQEEVARQVARYDLLAIPVVDRERLMMGIITHDDVIDVVREEATEDAHRSAAVAPLDTSYLKTHVITLGWKRGIWLTILFAAALLTAGALEHYSGQLARWEWLVWFIPLVISCGGNSGSQSATLVVTALATGDIAVRDWGRVLWREILQGILLGCFLALIGYFATSLFKPDVGEGQYNALVVPITVLLVVVGGTVLGALLPLLFQRLGLDPALMSNPFVAGIVDILGIVVYMTVASWMLA
ncbi:MAG: magnesium transporter [Planctomycetaceae bacterium]|nr:magnesium transporter [Planctomycetaceae bacterium]